ncbi:MAG: diguanylate cyclase [Methylobacteriaceae bacterium]|nr:diguanylate cyclase [Methylobacteriaceae bacterium]
MPRRPLYRGFLAIQLPIFLLAVALGLQLLASWRVSIARDGYAARVGAQTARIGKLVADLDLPAEQAQANRLLSLLLSDRGVLCVELVAPGLAPAAVAAPRRVGCRGETPDEIFNLALPDAPERSLRIGLSRAEIAEVGRQWRDYTIGLSLGAALLAAAAAGFAFRRAIGAPLRALLETIRASAEGGPIAPARKFADDEIGEVVDAFNLMQQRQRQDREALAAARDALGSIYDETPALLFTMTFDGVVVGAGRFFVEAVGYRRDEIVGRSFAQVVAPSARGRLYREALARLHGDGFARDVPLEVQRRDGEIIDVLFSAEIDPSDPARGRAVCVMTDVSALRAAERRLREQAFTDALTGLPNRAGFDEHLRAGLGAGRIDSLIAVMLVDLDDFKQVNDTWGHAAGDRLLIEAARRIRDCVAPQDLVARLGGDEFAIVCRQLAVPADAEAIARDIVGRFAEGIALEEGVARIGASVGVALGSMREGGAGELLRRADQAMYLAKRDGKNRCAVAGSSPAGRRAA